MKCAWDGSKCNLRALKKFQKFLMYFKNSWCISESLGYSFEPCSAQEYDRIKSEFLEFAPKALKLTPFSSEVQLLQETFEFF